MRWSFFLSVILCSTQLKAFDMNVTQDDMLRVEYSDDDLRLVDYCYYNCIYAILC